MPTCLIGSGFEHGDFSYPIVIDSEMVRIVVMTERVLCEEPTCSRPARSQLAIPMVKAIILCLMHVISDAILTN